MPRSVLVDRAAELLGVCRRTVYYRIRDGRLQTVRTRGGSQRVLVESIEALLRDTMKADGLAASLPADQSFGQASGRDISTNDMP
jgi:excisionase family DNA binding protein